MASLPVAGEGNRDGYSRDRFRHWIDADRDGCNTRHEVLIEEAVEPPQIAPRCRVTGGSWYSYYDDATWTDTDDLDIDHMVPLAEAWDSGASAWTDDRRKRYANDLDEPVALVVVTDRINQGKGDQDPAEWLPPRQDVHCRYLGEWVTVKLRWGLTADPAEKQAITGLTADCPDVELTFTRADQV
ncbi:HNH endonuclease family protein [Spongiactinospora sp. TRM90649]|uniref:HNH endonuclease family protein n=1 Tax=Spongiactinospora sp. TRM90649 TaxID=3031114 RepID=UPI0023F647C8|nr:HNH endonuclease family protein [Spongiactinospora sp. TRM90649]MDF5756630.1 HNH endonuclease family protein [Spongiactinospora sp. TRM90649]